MAVVIKRSCKILFPRLIAQTAMTKTKAVIALIPAYIGGKKDSGATLGIRTINNIATTIGIATEVTAINALILFEFIGCSMGFL